MLKPAMIKMVVTKMHKMMGRAEGATKFKKKTIAVLQETQEGEE